MKLELSINSKHEIRISISDPELKQLLRLNLVSINGSKLEFKTDILLDSTITKKDEIVEFVNHKFNPLFPTDIVSSGGDFGDYRISGNQDYCVKYLKEFFKHYPNYDLFTVWIATCVYLLEKSKYNFRGALKNFNFIRRELELVCNQVVNNPDESLIKAKTYIGNVQKHATRIRAKQLKRFDISKQLHESFGYSESDSPIGNLLGGGSIEQSTDTPILNSTGGGNGVSKSVGNSGEQPIDGYRDVLPSTIKPLNNWRINRPSK